MNEQEAFKVFLNSGLHGVKWPRVVYCFTTCYIDGEDMIVLVKNTPGGPHAEDNMLNLLREKIQNKSLTMSQKLTLYVSYSPCNNCSDLIIRFINEVKVQYNIDLTFDIAFPAFYKMRRPSCETFRGCSHKLQPYNVHERHLKGLKRLQNNGVTLRPMGRADWELLAIQLNDPFVYPGSAREREDKIFKEDFEEVINKPQAIEGMNSLLSMLGRLRLRGPFVPGDSDVSLHQNRDWQWF